MRRIAWLAAVIFACIMPHALAETEATPESLLDDALMQVKSCAR